MPFNLSNVTIKDIRHDIKKHKVRIVLEAKFVLSDLDELDKMGENEDLLYDLELKPLQAKLPGFDK